MAKKLERILLFLIFVLLPGQLAYHFWPDWSLINGIRVDYLSPAIYFTDVLIWTLVLVSRRWYRISRLLLIWVVINVLVSFSPLLSISKWLRVYEYYWFYRYLVSGSGNDSPEMKSGLGLAVVWTSLLAWVQFWLQRAVGDGWYWLGERAFNLTTPGIARAVVGGRLVLRAYATLPHPNALAGWLVISGLLAGSWLPLLAWSTTVVTFSRSALLALPLYFWRKSKLLVCLLFVSGWLLFIHIGNPTSFSERWQLVVASLKIIKDHWLTGVGLGNFVYAVPYVRQPVHNIYLLLAGEMGIPVTGLMFLQVFRQLVKINNYKLKISVIWILLIGLVDHYWVTLPQNMLLVAVLAAAVKIKHSEAANLL